MDNKKIGKLIAELRKKQGLTQQELGDKVGVGFRAVSKWETGLTLPDISIINELSKILGISSDELLTGKIKKENESKNKKKIPVKIKVTITIMIVMIVILSSVFMYYDNKTYVYDIYTENKEEYYIKGKVTFGRKKIFLTLSKIDFKDPIFLSTKIKNYEYDILLGENRIFRYGYDEFIENLDGDITVSDLSRTLNIVYDNTIDYNGEKDLCLVMRFIDENNNVITKKIDLVLFSAK